jgi:hypothetical protein
MNYKRAALLAAVHGMAITFGGRLLMAAPGWNGDYLNVIGKGEATPHEKLAQPYANGKPRVFFLVGENREQAAEVVELDQRIDIDYDGLTTNTWQEFGATDMYGSSVQGSTAEEKERALVGKLSQPWDAIVIAGFQWDCLPPSCRSLIMDAVANKGTGLALIQFREREMRDGSEFSFAERDNVPPRLSWGKAPNNSLPSLFSAWIDTPGDPR